MGRSKEPVASTDRQRSWKHPGLPTEWTRVIEEMPAGMLLPLPPGYVLLDARKDRPLRAWAAHLEFRG
jgi:hypothetical protein